MTLTELIAQIETFSEERIPVSSTRLMFSKSESLIVIDFRSKSDDDDELEEFCEDRYDEHFYEHRYSTNDLTNVWLSISAIQLGHDDMKFYHNNYLSVHGSMIETIRTLRKVDPGLVISTNLETNFGYDNEGGFDMCGGPFNYLFRIELSLPHLNNPTSIDRILKSFRTKIFPSECFSCFQDFETYYKNGRIQILNTNTKARRFLYLFEIAKQFPAKGGLPNRILNKFLENKVSNLTSELRDSGYSKGLVISKGTGNSIKPYTDLAISMGLLSEANNSFLISKKFRIFISTETFLSSRPLKDRNHDNLRNYFFLQWLLETDFLYLSCLIELINLEETVSTVRLIQIFQSSVLRRLDWLLQNCNGWKKVEIQNIEIIRTRIHDWKKPKVYLEHVLAPRLNWLKDMSLLIEVKPNVWALTKSGSILNDYLESWTDLNYGYPANMDWFLSEKYSTIFKSVYQIEIRVASDIERTALVNEYLGFAFDFFKTLAPNRISLNQTSAFISACSLFDKSVVLEQSEVSRMFEAELSDHVVVKQHRQLNDGYIQKRLSK